MAQNVAAYAVFAWLAAEAPVDFGSGPALIADEQAAASAQAGSDERR
jgi:hypothetical protein